MKRFFIFFILSSLLILSCLPLTHAETYTETRYATTDFIPLNQPHLKLNNSASSFYYEHNVTYAFGSPQSEYGFRAYIYFSNGSISELTSGLPPEAIVIRTVDGEGLQNATWTCPDTNSTKDSSMYIELWSRLRVIPFGGTAWAILSGGGYSRFQTEPLGALTFNNSTWNMTYYTYRLKIGNTYTHRIWFGNSTHYTRIDNIQYEIGGYAGFVFMFFGVIVAVVVVLALTLSKKK